MSDADRDELIQRVLMELPCVVANGGYMVLKRSSLITWLLGYVVTKKDVIHHKNENKLDDRPDNLEVLTRRDHARHHAKANFGTGLRKYTEQHKESLRQKMLGNQYAKGWIRPELYLKNQSENMKEIWRQRKAGERPMPKLGKEHRTVQ